MADNETIADIIAEMRKTYVSKGGAGYCGEVWIDLLRYADRLEAALKRDTKELRVEIERLKEERNYSGVRERERLRAKGFAIVPKEQLERGNAAKLREATEAVLLAFNYGESTIVNQLPFSKLLPMLRKCVEALAAPPRNCDVYNADELKVIFKRELVSQLPIANEHEKNLVAITATGVIDTLLAPVTEKEGGAI